MKKELFLLNLSFRPQTKQIDLLNGSSSFMEINCSDISIKNNTEIAPNMLPFSNFII